MNPAKLAEALNNRSLHLILMNTEKCNFRCVYCYEDFLLGKMPSDVITGVKNLITIRAESLDILYVSWFGGEPLLQTAVIKDVMTHAIKVCCTHGIPLKSGMTTNGYNLSIETLGMLCDLHVNEFQITLDGDSKSHNTTRLRADGKGTFKKIWRNFRAAHESNLQFKIMIRMHVTSRNYDSIVSLVRQIIQELRNDERFSLTFHKVNDYKQSESPIYLDSTKYADILSKLKNEAKLHCVNTLPRDSDYICYAAKPNSLVVRADGSLAKCTVAFNHDENKIGRLCADGSLTLDAKKMKFWLGGFETVDEDFLGCPAAHLTNW